MRMYWNDYEFFLNFLPRLEHLFEGGQVQANEINGISFEFEKHFCFEWSTIFITTASYRNSCRALTVKLASIYRPNKVLTYQIVVFYQVDQIRLRITFIFRFPRKINSIFAEITTFSEQILNSLDWKSTCCFLSTKTLTRILFQSITTQSIFIYCSSSSRTKFYPKRNPFACANHWRGGVYSHEIK